MIAFKELVVDDGLNYFCGMVDPRKTISTIFSRNHC